MIDRSKKITGRFYATASDRRPVRVIFCIVHGEMVLLHGFEKTTQKTPAHDIDLAFRRKREIGG